MNKSTVYKSISVKGSLYAELEELAQELSTKIGMPVTVPGLIHKMKEEFKKSLQEK